MLGVASGCKMELSIEFEIGETKLHTTVINTNRYDMTYYYCT